MGTIIKTDPSVLPVMEQTLAQTSNPYNSLGGSTPIPAILSVSKRAHRDQIMCPRPHNQHY